MLVIFESGKVIADVINRKEGQEIQDYYMQDPSIVITKKDAKRILEALKKER